MNHDNRPAVTQLLTNLKEQLPELRKLLEWCNSEWVGEDGLYRFYHQSFKVFYLQDATLKICRALYALAPEQPVNLWFSEIISDGTGKEFNFKTTNQNWLRETRPIVEAFFHARAMLEMAVKYGDELTRPPGTLPSGWAMFLYLFNLR